MERMASCQCGNVSIIVSGEPVLVTACNCTLCQRRSGSVFAVSSRWTRAQIVSRSGDCSRFERIGSSGGRVRLEFCPRCGSTMAVALDAMPDVIGIPVGAFADPHFPAPQAFFWCEHKADWVEFPEEIPQLPQQALPSE